MSTSTESLNQSGSSFGFDVSTFLKTNQYVSVVKQESHIVGFACAFGCEDELLGTMLDCLHVLSSQQGKGTGRKLIRDIAV